MKLQRVVNLKAYDKTYYKWLLNLPPTLIEELGWSEGEELVGDARDGVLRVRRVPAKPERDHAPAGRPRRATPK